MTRIINLRQARKQRQRADKRAEADSNAARFGEPRMAREAREAESERADRTHQSHRRDDR
ncbi:DUF4169 family protein [Paracoccus salsus]|uniref:DUF4169 family protein n=1 Tax=Paracoccus salsus TaxID=2911061 RepID=UPI001F390AF9|nr:DUF4169 family protein [Paracoccus salsus]MCF3972166.1 DUF4169 family protein [Paracoccus salsus]